ncbi:DUF3363 domain-containing protein [Ancylobacter oerskovii]|uniref:DUF3363 domain-containing protein n=1 Tax=Ancylobacter oerskovii TaxID=459519 RepID=A0ABW4Z0J0_9HYPH|nr:DUF3363 domain-containing protein [Ancylobacter oerskovii]MBS7542850.1 relaxase/mobilization nuclease and DUF3363 domain-containing protein [Ancylobacter oerskovii]
MAQEDSDKFRVRPGRIRQRGTRGSSFAKVPFRRQVEIAVREAGGWSGRKGGGRYNARGRGVRAAGTLSSVDRGWKADAGGRHRSRRVVVKARVVKLGVVRGRGGRKTVGASAKAVDAHLRYLQRDGVTPDRQKGRCYSASEDEVDGKAFLERGREDRHQFRFIVAPEDGLELGDLKGFTRELMGQMESDLGTKLDWIAVDHHNTGHPHTHVLVRGVTDEGRALTIAGDYIAHGIRHRASDIVTRELGPQSEIELQQKLVSEVGAERLTRLDRLLIQEQEREGFVDLFTSGNRLIRENRDVLIGRLRKLEAYGLAREDFAGEWMVSSRTQATLIEIEAQNDVMRSIHQALKDNGIADERGSSQYRRHGQEPDQTLTGRVLGKGLAGDGLSEASYLVIDGVDARVHHVEFPDASRLDELQRGMIVEVTPPITQPRVVDLNIQQNADQDGIYSPGTHLARIRDRFAEQGKDPEAYIRSHIRRLEALRRAGHVERVHAEHWTIPKDLPERGLAYDRSLTGEGPGIKIASQLSLDRQISADGATWLDRELVAPTPRSPNAFGRDVTLALEQRRATLVDMGFATRGPGGGIEAPDLINRLQRREVERVAADLAKSTGLAYRPSGRGEYVSGTVTRQLQLISGRFAMLEDGLGFQLVPWQPVLDKQIGRHISGVMRGDGGIEWSIGRQRGLGL